jgi:hypothetical protein
MYKLKLCALGASNGCAGLGLQPGGMPFGKVDCLVGWQNDGLRAWQCEYDLNIPTVDTVETSC